LGTLQADTRVFKVIKAHEASFPNPVRTRKGDVLAAEERKTLWEGWLLCTNQQGGEVWVPKNFVDWQGNTAVMQRDYDSTELTVTVGEELVGEEEAAGWVWVTNQAGESGWVPLDNLEVMNM
jgi:hypothetical protein